MKNINISEVLKAKPLGTKLYSPLFGEVNLLRVNSSFITVEYKASTNNRCTSIFFNNGKYYKDSPEISIFPSKVMTDWNKFNWKKGDILVCNKEETPTYYIFENFENDRYTVVKARFIYKKGEKYYRGKSVKYVTRLFESASDKEAALFDNITDYPVKESPVKENIEFKDGDFIYIEGNKDALPIIGIYKKKSLNIINTIYVHIAYIEFNGGLIVNDKIIVDNKKIRKATKLEKVILKAVLSSHNMIWDSFTKSINHIKEPSTSTYYISTTWGNKNIIYNGK